MEERRSKVDVWPRDVKPLRGVIAAASTPFGDDLAPDIAECIRHCRLLLDAGCDGIAPIGSVGEGASLSVGERLSVLDGLAEGGLPMDRMVPEIGCCAFPDAIELSRRAVDLGAAGVMLAAPYFYKGVSDEGLFDYFSRVIDGIGKNRLRLYLFDFGRVTGVSMSLPWIQKLSEHFPGIVVGLKGGGSDIQAMSLLIRELEGIAVYTGWERLTLENVSLGGGGSLSATTNLTARLAVQVLDSWRRGDQERAEITQRALTAAANAITDRGAYTAIKAVLAAWTGRATWSLVRPPLRTLDPDEAAKLVRDLDALGVCGLLGGQEANSKVTGTPSK